MKSQPNTTTIAHEPCFIDAKVWTRAAHEDCLLEVMASTVVEETDECYQPVLEFLAPWCSCRTSTGLVIDQQWMFGEYIRTAYELYATCPGRAKGHCCAFVRAGRVRSDG